MVWQVFDEPDRVAEQYVAPVGDGPFPRSRIKRREELVGCKNIGAGNGIHQSALAGIRIADERNRHMISTLRHHLPPELFNVLEFSFQFVDTAIDQPAVRFKLLFTRTAPGSHTTFDPLQVAPHALQPRSKIEQLSQFDLQLRFVGPGPTGKDVEDDFTAINNNRIQFAFQVPSLARAQRVIEHDKLGSQPVDHRLQLFELPAAHYRGGVGCAAFLSECADDFNAGRLHKSPEFLKRFCDAVAFTSIQHSGKHGLLIGDFELFSFRFCQRCIQLGES